MSDGMPAHLPRVPPHYATEPRVSALPPPAQPTAAHPCLTGMLRQAFYLAGALILFAGGLAAGRSALLAWPAAVDLSAPEAETAALEKLGEDLNLSPAQREQVAPFVRSACTDLRLAAEQGKALRLAILDEAGATIAPRLSPAQRGQLEALQEEWQHRPSRNRDRRIVALF